MTKMRLDPSFVESERWERLGSDALLLHLAAIAYCVRTSSDGALTMARVNVLSPLVSAPRKVAEVLIEDGLWAMTGDGRVQVCAVHDDLRRADGRGDEQPSKAFVDKERARAQEAKARWREKRKAEENAAGNDPWNEEGNPIPDGGRNGAQWSGVQSSAVQDPKGPSPVPHAEACVHGFPGGQELTKAGTPRCPECRGLRLATTSTSTSRAVS